MSVWQGVALDGNYAHGYNILGTLLRPAKGQGLSSAEAMKAYETALVLAPTFVDATLNLAGLLVEEERFDDSLRVVRWVVCVRVRLCVRACVRLCVRACVRACVCVCVCSEVDFFPTLNPKL